MKSFKISVTKNQKKYNIIINAEDEVVARDNVHKEGYSILSIEEVSNNIISGEKFIFTGEIDGKIKTGKIVGTDIFKLYLKLRKDLGYKVISLFHEKEESSLTNEGKEKIIKDLESEYDIFISANEEKEKKVEEKKDNIKETNSGKVDSFYLKKELEETYKLINFILEKLKNLIENKEVSNLSDENKDKLRIASNTITKLKNTTNISKLKEIGELALLKIGEIELNELERTKSEQTKGLLKETNKLLKELGSQKQFIEKDKDINLITQNFLSKISLFLKRLTNKEKKYVHDTQSHSYNKMKMHLKKYQSKLHENTKALFNLVNLFTLVKREELLLKRKIIKQNIALLKAKEKGVGFSYTKVKKGYETIINLLGLFASKLRGYIFFIIILYISIFIVYFSLSYYLELGLFNYKGLFYFILLLVFYFLLYFRLNLINIILNFVILFFIIIFALVNL